MKSISFLRKKEINTFGDLFMASVWAFVIASGWTVVFSHYILDIYRVRFFLFLFLSSFYFYVQDGPHKEKVKKKKIQDKYDQELSSYIDLIARVNALLIQYEETEDATEAYHREQEIRTKIDQQYMSWYRQNGLFERKGVSLEKLHYGNKIEKAFEHCDQWNWSERREEHIGEH